MVQMLLLLLILLIMIFLCSLLLLLPLLWVNRLMMKQTIIMILELLHLGDVPVGIVTIILIIRLIAISSHIMQIFARLIPIAMWREVSNSSDFTILIFQSRWGMMSKGLGILVTKLSHLLRRVLSSQWVIILWTPEEISIILWIIVNSTIEDLAIRETWIHWVFIIIVPIILRTLKNLILIMISCSLSSRIHSSDCSFLRIGITRGGNRWQRR